MTNAKPGVISFQSLPACTFLEFDRFRACLVLMQERTGLVVDRSAWLQNRKHCVVVAIVATLFLAYPLCSHGQEPPNDLRIRQIEALTTGDTSGLSQVRERSLQVQLTQRWTSIAAGMLKKASANLDPDSALLFSKFIYRGAFQFVREGRSVQSAYWPEGNLRKFIEAAIEIGEKENPRQPLIGKTTFEQAKRSTCPLWPFC